MDDSELRLSNDIRSTFSIDFSDFNSEVCGRVVPLLCLYYGDEGVGDVLLALRPKVVVDGVDFGSVGNLVSSSEGGVQYCVDLSGFELVGARGFVVSASSGCSYDEEEGYTVCGDGSHHCCASEIDSCPSQYRSCGVGLDGASVRVFVSGGLG